MGREILKREDKYLRVEENGREDKIMREGGRIERRQRSEDEK